MRWVVVEVGVVAGGGGVGGCALFLVVVDRVIALVTSLWAFRWGRVPPYANPCVDKTPSRVSGGRRGGGEEGRRGGGETWLSEG